MNPYCDVTVSVTVPCPPEPTVSKEGEVTNVKFAGGAGETARETVVVSEIAPLVPATVSV